MDARKRSKESRGRRIPAPYRPPPRREFFKYLVNGTVAVIVAVLDVPLAGFYALSALRKREPVWKEAGPVRRVDEHRDRVS